MKKLAIFSGVFFISITILWIAGRLTNTLQFFSVTTTSNYPTIMMGDKIFGSNLMRPKRFDHICYHAEAPVLGKVILVHRLVGLEGDKIEIKYGRLYVNDQSSDSALSLAHNYVLPSTELTRLKQVAKVDEYATHEISEGSFITYASDKVIKNSLIKARREILSADFADEAISTRYGANWNRDNFGPVIVPAGRYFVLGDNRSYSQDSRYQGFIEKSQYIATAFGSGKQ